MVIHLTGPRDFARLVKPFSDLRYPCSSTDQTFSKENYLDDADDVEVTLETSGRLRGVRPVGSALEFISVGGVELLGASPRNEICQA